MPDQSIKETPFITLTLEPQLVTKQMPRPKTAKQLLDQLGYLEETAIVVRNGQLLTPDRAIYEGDSIMVRRVISAG